MSSAGGGFDLKDLPPAGGTIPIEDTLCIVALRNAARTGSLVTHIPDTLHDPRTQAKWLCREGGMRSYVGVPVKVQGMLLANICMAANEANGARITATDVVALEATSKVVAEMIIAKAQLARVPAAIAAPKEQRAAQAVAPEVEAAALADATRVYGALGMRALLREADACGLGEAADQLDSKEEIVALLGRHQLQRTLARQAELAELGLRQLIKLAPEDTGDAAETKAELIAAILQAEGLVIGAVPPAPAPAPVSTQPPSAAPSATVPAAPAAAAPHFLAPQFDPAVHQRPGPLEYDPNAEFMRADPVRIPEVTFSLNWPHDPTLPRCPVPANEKDRIEAVRSLQIDDVQDVSLLEEISRHAAMAIGSGEARPGVLVAINIISAHQLTVVATCPPSPVTPMGVFNRELTSCSFCVAKVDEQARRRTRTRKNKKTME